jgi:hypothetical protein
LSGEDFNPHTARFKIGLGLLAKAQRDVDATRTYLRDGLALAEAEGFEILASRARRALAGL